MKWIYHRLESDFEKMTDVGKALREKLSASCYVGPPKTVFEKGAVDGTHKWLLGMKRFWAIALTSSLVVLAGCHSFKKENVEPPTPLDKKFEPTLKVDRVWKSSIGDGAAESGVRMCAAAG